MKRFRAWAIALAAVLVLVLATGLANRHLLARVWRKTVPEAGGPAGVRLARPEPDRSLRLEQGGPALAADLYLPEGGSQAARCAVLLIHGNRAEGGRAPLYRLWAREWARRGCLAMALSLRGFGESEPAPLGRAVRSADLLDDVERGIEALDRLAPAGAPRGVVGHSIGANLALRLADRPGWRAVAIEPGRRLRQRVVDEPAPELDAFATRLARNLRGGVLDRETVRALYRDLDPEGAPAGAGAAVTLILQGREIGPADRRSIEAAAAAGPGRRLAWLESGDHDFGVLGEGRLVFHAGKLTKTISDITLSFVTDEKTQGGETEKQEP